MFSSLPISAFYYFISSYFGFKVLIYSFFYILKIEIYHNFKPFFFLIQAVKAMYFPPCTTLSESRKLICYIYIIIQLKLFLSNSFWLVCYLNISLIFKLQCFFRYCNVIAFNMIHLWLMNIVYRVLILQHLWHPLRLILWLTVVYLDECFIFTWKEHVFYSRWVQHSISIN